MKPEEDSFGKPGEHIRVYFEEDTESGHAIYLGHGLAQVKNIPMTERCGLDDVVTLEARGPDEIPVVDEVVHRSYDHKTTIHYDIDQEFYKLVLLLNSMGCAVEGGVAEDEIAKRRGFFLVQYNDPVNPMLIAEGFGIKKPWQKGTS